MITDAGSTEVEKTTVTAPGFVRVGLFRALNPSGPWARLLQEGPDDIPEKECVKRSHEMGMDDFAPNSLPNLLAADTRKGQRCDAAAISIPVFQLSSDDLCDEPCLAAPWGCSDYAYARVIVDYCLLFGRRSSHVSASAVVVGCGVTLSTTYLIASTRYAGAVN